MIKTKKFFSAAGAVALLCAVSILISGCAKGNKFLDEGDTFKDKKTKVVYNYAPACYEPISPSEKIYGQTKDSDFYSLEGIDPLKWLCEEGGTVFYASDLTLPSISEMSISYIDICTSDTTTITRAKISNANDISEIISAYADTDGIYYLGHTPETTYKIRFADASIGVYYSLSFIRYSEDYISAVNGEEKNYGKDFLYNRFEGKFVPAPEALVNYINEL